ncbi:MAG TPA: DNA mismatch repair protein MutL, partial [Roseiflexaceae bacterium]
ADRAPVQAGLLDRHRSADDAAAQRHPDRSADPDTAAPYPPLELPAAALRELPVALHGSPDDERPTDAMAPAAAGVPTTRTQGVPPLRALAQLALTYLLTEGPDGALYLIDQHAAHERITYERLLAAQAVGAVQAQALLLPQHVALPPSAQQALLAAAGELATWGLVLAEADHGVQVRAVPVGLALDALGPTLADLASHLGGSGGPTPADRRDATLATLACHTSVRAGQALTLAEQQALLDQLAGCEGPRTCPHGRPTLIVITPHQLARQFGRLGA